MATKTRRSQTPKPRNHALAMAMQDKRRGSGTERIPSGTQYKRTVKHRSRMYD